MGAGLPTHKGGHGGGVGRALREFFPGTPLIPSATAEIER